MIGSVTFKCRAFRGRAVVERDCTATLHASGEWTFDPADDVCPGPGVRTMLDSIVRAYEGPQHGFFGPGQVEQAAEALGGTAHVEPWEPPPYVAGIKY